MSCYRGSVMSSQRMMQLFLLCLSVAPLSRSLDSVHHTAFHILTAWRRGLPSLTLKFPMLARFLIRVGRSELARELLHKEASDDKMEERKAKET